MLFLGSKSDPNSPPPPNNHNTSKAPNACQSIAVVLWVSFLLMTILVSNFSYGQKEKQIPVLASWNWNWQEFLVGGEYLCLLEGKKKLMLWRITRALVIYDYKF